MNKRRLGKTNQMISEIGYGAWGIGQRWWGPTDDSESLKALQVAWDLGVNFFDTAYVYGDGHSEELIGKALRNKNAVIATKIPPKNQEWPGNPKTPVADVFPADWIVSCTERSLQKLGRDTIDLTQLHVWSDAWLHSGDWQKAVTQLKKAGKIKSFGVSINDHDPASALQLVASGCVDTVQVIFNIFDQSPLEELFPLCKKNNVGVIVRVPFDEGGLTGTLTPNSTFEGDDLRKHYFGGKNLLDTIARVEKLKVFLGKDAASLPELALKFILSADAVSTVIPGMRREHHVRSNVAVSGSRPLSAATRDALRQHAWKRNFYGWWD